MENVNLIMMLKATRNALLQEINVLNNKMTAIDIILTEFDCTKGIDQVSVKNMLLTGSPIVSVPLTSSLEQKVKKKPNERLGGNYIKNGDRIAFGAWKYLIENNNKEASSKLIHAYLMEQKLIIPTNSSSVASVLSVRKATFANRGAGYYLIDGYEMPRDVNVRDTYNGMAPQPHKVETPAEGMLQ